MSDSLAAPPSQRLLSNPCSQTSLCHRFDNHSRAHLAGARPRHRCGGSGVPAGPRVMAPRNSAHLGSEILPGRDSGGLDPLGKQRLGVRVGRWWGTANTAGAPTRTDLSGHLLFSILCRLQPAKWAFSPRFTDGETEPQRRVHVQIRTGMLEFTLPPQEYHRDE